MCSPFEQLIEGEPVRSLVDDPERVLLQEPVQGSQNILMSRIKETLRSELGGDEATRDGGGGEEERGGEEVVAVERETP